MSGALSAVAAVGPDSRAIARVDAPQHPAEAAGTAQRQLLAELSHDLRTPLTSVRLLVKAPRDDLVGEDRRSEYLARIELEVLLMSELVDDLHSGAREQAADRGTRARCVEPAGIVEAAVETMRIQTEVKGVSLSRTYRRTCRRSAETRASFTACC
jgi:signal transduction histidine kinase